MAQLHTMSFQSVDSPQANILANIRSAYAILWERVSVALQTMVGDAARLDAVRTQALELMHSGEQVCSNVQQLCGSAVTVTIASYYPPC